MTDDIARARALLAAATPGPWIARPASDEDGQEEADRIVTVRYAPPHDSTQREVVVGTLWYDGPHTLVSPADAALIAAAPELLAAFADEIDRLTGQLAVVRAERDEARRTAISDLMLANGRTRDSFAADLSAALARVVELEAQLEAVTLMPPDPAESRIADLVRALPDAEPPVGYVERVEVRRLEAAVVEAVVAWREAELALDEYEESVPYGKRDVEETDNMEWSIRTTKKRIRDAVDVLRAARDRAGKAGGE